MALDVIWKFPLQLREQQMISIPADYSILSAGIDPVGNLCIWAMVDQGCARRDFEIRIIGTGNKHEAPRPAFPSLGSFIGTVLDGAFVWHVFTGPADDARMPAHNAFHYLTRGRG